MSLEHPAVDVVIEPAPDAGKKAAITPFSFPFKPSEFASAKDQAGKDQAWYQKSNKPGHHKTPGAAPSGTRRSMGKR